jgi:hypothetical protein
MINWPRQRLGCVWSNLKCHRSSESMPCCWPIFGARNPPEFLINLNYPAKTSYWATIRHVGLTKAWRSDECWGGNECQIFSCWVPGNHPYHRVHFTTFFLDTFFLWHQLPDSKIRGTLKPN